MREKEFLANSPSKQKPIYASALLSSFFSPGDPADPADVASEAWTSYNSAADVARSDLEALGAAAAGELALTADDVVCVPMTLNHGMGMGFGHHGLAAGCCRRAAT